MNKLRIIVSWTARVTAGICFLFWGAFFVAHMSEWFIRPIFTKTQLPPLSVCLRMLLHLGFLVGYIIGFKWELIGGLLVVVSASTFFISIGVLKFLPLSILPGILFLIAWTVRHYTKPAIGGITHE